MDKDSTGKPGPKSTNTVGSGAPATPGASGQRDTRSGVTHTDTAEGLGGGRLTEEGAPTATDAGDADDTSPTNRQSGDAENAKSSDARSPSGNLHGQDPEDVAARMKSTGRDTGNA